MKKLFTSLAIAAISTQLVSANLVDIWHDDGYAMHAIEDITHQIPEIEVGLQQEDANWKFLPNVAQYKAADWSTCVGIAHNVTPKEAKEIADSHAEITFFFFVKGGCMILENTQVTPQYVRVFQQGDAVFFKGDPESTAVWGTAPGLADGYVRH